MSKRSSDLIAGIVSILIALAFLIEGRLLKPLSIMFPRVLIYFIIIAGAFVVIRGILGKRESPEEHEGLNWRRAFIIILASVLYVICIIIIGFYVSTIVYLVLGSWYLNERGFTFRSLAFSLVFGVGVSAVLYAAFTAFLQVPTPAGLLF